jgi:glucoamylase
VTDDAFPQGKAPASSAILGYWTSSAKDAIGAARGAPRLWFTVAQGIVTEVYHPRPDVPQLKDLGFIVADGSGFWIEVRRLSSYDVAWVDDVVPAITVTHRHPRFTLKLEICADPERDVLLVDFELRGEALELYVIAAPRLGGDTTRNEAAAGEWCGWSVLWAQQGPFGLALAAVDRRGAPALLERSVGCVGVSDGWQDFNRHGVMRWHYAEAGPGEVALTARLPVQGTLALGVSTSREAAATLTRQSLLSGFAPAWHGYCESWRRWLAGIAWPPALGGLFSREIEALIRRSAVVIECHADRTFPGAIVASLSVPWGESSSSRGGYHLVWARDLVESAGALVAVGAFAEARQVLVYLMATQQGDGHWLQNQWLGGKPFWQGIQLDETAFPVLLASALAEHDALGGLDVRDMVRRALAFIARQGPVTCQDRWEENTGINTFTLTMLIAALIDGSHFLDGREAECAVMLADSWNARLEEWTWVHDTALARTLGVRGYYMRSAPANVLIHEGAKHEATFIRNHAQDAAVAADEQLAIDCLQLARYGLRAHDDPMMTASVRAIDRLLRTDTPAGPVWHRYNGDGYGEHADGAAFDGTGRGRGWPLLTGERGHFALLAGEDARPYLVSMQRMAGRGGLLPEQVWDGDPIPDRGLSPGRPSGSAMPLVWAHSEFIKLALSIAAGEPVDRPVRTAARYASRRPRLGYALWLPRQRINSLSAGQELRLLLPEPARVHWGTDGWLRPADVATEDWGFGHVARLPTGGLDGGTRIDFTFYWPARDEWQGEDFRVDVARVASIESAD